MVPGQAYLRSANPEHGVYIGVMSGTSMDGLDVCAVDFSGQRPRVIAHLATDLADLRPALRRLALGNYTSDSDPIDELGRLDQLFAERISDSILSLLRQNNLSPEQIVAIGSHGQTIRHRPDRTPPFTLQIGDPNRIAERCGIPVIADLRRRDMAAGGQAAPLVPPAHRALFGPVSENECLIVVNLGGISNITILAGDAEPMGFDTGPANTLMDAWIQRHLGESFDQDGAWAASGQVDAGLLQRLLSDPYFTRTPPKSTGIEHFHLDWLAEMGMELLDQLPANDVQATLAELTATTLVDALRPWLTDKHAVRIVLSGGGARNRHLSQRIRAQVESIRTGMMPAGIHFQTASEVGIDSQHVECAAFAWLARQFLLGLPGNAPSVTGADGPRILGSYFPA